jgi:hypothetical protein
MLYGRAGLVVFVVGETPGVNLEKKRAKSFIKYRASFDTRSSGRDSKKAHDWQKSVDHSSKPKALTQRTVALRQGERTALLELLLWTVP